MNGGDGDDLIHLGAGNDYLNVSSLGNDTVTGDDGYDYIYTFTGADSIAGGAGNDTLLGYAGNDFLNGGADDDSLYGGYGIDTMLGGDGADTLLGGVDFADDVFRFTAVSQSTTTRSDQIFDMEGIGIAGGDRIDLSAIDANTTVAGNQAFIFGGTGAGHLSLVNAGADTLILADVDGGGADLQIIVHDGDILAGNWQAADFIL
ncbi:calcium-binding protein [Defluviicoccus vanus]|uniref:calcium-binding protein n=1 Tax=Defluviicoccus vanus TaxID=111831 RepID=UPI0021D7CC9C|nr:calcium-binding protein [Defluviicoccus vanus]